MKKKFYAKVLFLGLLISLPPSAHAYGFEVDGIYYSIVSASNRTASVTYDSEGCYSGDIVIPSRVKSGAYYYSVTAIGTKAFSGCTGLTSVEIPNSVTDIGRNAF